MNAQQIIAAVGGSLTISVMLGTGLLRAGDGRYVLKQEAQAIVQSSQCTDIAAEIEWLETLNDSRRLSSEQVLKLTWLKRQKAEKCD